MFDATCLVLKNIINDGATYAQRGDADAAYDVMTSFDFVFILHLMRDIMGITNALCLALQEKHQDIVNAMQLVSTIKSLIQKLRDEGWHTLLEEVRNFCSNHEIEIPDLNARYIGGRGRGRRQQEFTSIEHHYRIDVFTAMIDSQLQELNYKFNDQVVELLILRSTFNPKHAFKSFKTDDVYNLAVKFYPEEFTEQEKIQLRFQCEHYILDVTNHPDFQNMSTISELCQGLAVTGKAKVYNLIDRLARLVLTLLVSTATTERSFSAMKIVKTRLQNKMADRFLADNLVVYIEKELAENFTTDMIIEEFDSMKCRRAHLS